LWRPLKKNAFTFGTNYQETSFDFEEECANDMVILRFVSDVPADRDESGPIFKAARSAALRKLCRFSLRHVQVYLLELPKTLNSWLRRSRVAGIHRTCHDNNLKQFEFLTCAGSFVLPEPVHGMKRLMISAGV
jgi:hypothetical protein